MNGVTIAQAVVVSEHRHAALPAELAGSLILAVADALTTLSLKVGPAELVLLEDGTVRVCGGIPTDEPSAEQSLRLLLDRILRSACSVTPALLRAAQRPSQGKVSLLVRELEVALIPTNRGAARRALARLCREVSQAIRQYPNLQQAVDAFRFPDTAVVKAEVVEPQASLAESMEPPAAEYSFALSVSPVPVTILEPEAIDEWVEISPVFPEVIATPAQSDRIVRSWDGPVSNDIPDLEIPIAGKQEKPPSDSPWQPVEHTQRLSPMQRSKTPIANIIVAPVQAPILDLAPPPTVQAPILDLAPPPTITPPPAWAADPEVVELSDSDLREVTAEIAVAPAIASSPTFTHPLVPVAEPEVVELSDSDLREVTAEIAVASAAAPVIAASPLFTPPSALTAELEVELPKSNLLALTAELQVTSLATTSTIFAEISTAAAIESIAPDEHQTAEPFSLVAPVLLQNTDHDTTVSEVECSTSALPKDAATLEPCAGESEDTVLDAVTFVDEERTAVPVLVEEISLLEFDSEPKCESLQFANFTPSEPITSIVEPIEDMPPSILGPHSYVAPARFSRTANKVSDRIAQFSVAKIPSHDELTNGLRSLAGVENESTSEPSATPPPTAYATERVDCDDLAPKGVFVRTLIGLGTTGLLIVLAQLYTGQFTKVSAAATNVPIEVSRRSCNAILKLDEVPLGTTVHVSQNGPRPRSEILRVSQLPFRIDGLSCGEPAELLVKLSERGWYRIPIEGNRLSGVENSEPVRIATYVKSR